MTQIVNTGAAMKKFSLKKMVKTGVLLMLLSSGMSAANAAGIVFSFGSNVTAERQAALEAAATEIEGIINFRQNIKVHVAFSALECSNFSAVLGFAGPQTAYGNFSGAPQTNTWYVSAQAADMGFANAMDDTVHISAEFNNNLGSSGCLTGTTWYFGTDHNPASNQVDFLSTAIHEFMHGLGFLSFIGSDGQLASGMIDNYSTFLLDNSSGKSWKNMTAGERAASILNNHNLIWNGSKTTAMVSLLQAGTTAGKAQLYAPSSYEGGSSTSHFDVSLLYDNGDNEVMEPIADFPEDSALASAAFCDMGWLLLRDTDGDGENDCDDSDPLVVPDADGDGVMDAQDAFPNNAAASVDTDGDGKPDSWHQPNPYGCAVDAATCNGLTLDSDSDNDGIDNAVDNCVLVPNADQMDYDEDGSGDACDPLPMPSVEGALNKDKMGSAVAYVGDVDGDNYGDYAIGTPGYDVPAEEGNKAKKNAGRVVVISGKTQLPIITLDGDEAGDALGSALAGGGDIDGDGFDDVVVGAPKADKPADGGSKKIVDAGSATILFGPDGTRKPVFFGASARAAAGSAVALCDLNGDGESDVLIGAPKDDGAGFKDNGSVMVIGGGVVPAPVAWSPLYGAASKANFGSSVAAANVDLIAGQELIVGAPNENNTGSVSVFAAGNSTPLFKKSGATTKAHFGKAVAGGNVNGDARDDVIVGAPDDDNGTVKNTGSVSIFSGDGTLLRTKFGSVSGAALGSSVAVADVNGDGKKDIIAGAPKEDIPATSGSKKITDAGGVSIWTHSTGTTFDLFTTLQGESAKDYFGTAVSAGHIDGDGKAEVLVGAPSDDIPAIKTIKDGGSVSIYAGASLP